MDGFINLLKPPGITSSDAVLFVRKRLPRKTAVGHGGTLDPDAAGVLPVCVGRATRLFDYIIDKQKTYIGEICLGSVTDTCDASGKVLETRPVRGGEKEIRAVLPEFTGAILQTPPMYSALKVNGKKLYELARKGEELDLPAREVQVYGIEYRGQTGENRHLLEITCGKGTYIRSLMRDIGEKLGCGGHMSFLLRSKAGAFDVNNAHTLEELDALDDLSSVLEPMDALLGAYPRVDVLPEFRRRVTDGIPVKPEWLTAPAPDTNQPLRIYVKNEFAGMGAINEEGNIAFRAMLLRASEKA